MSKESKIDHIDGKKIKLEDNHEKLFSLGAIYKNSVIDCFKIKCMKFFTNQLDGKSVRVDNTFNNIGKIVYTTF